MSKELRMEAVIYLKMLDGESEEDALSRAYNLADEAGLEMGVYNHEERECEQWI